MKQTSANFQVTQGIRQNYDGELHVFCIITERSIDVRFLAFGYDAWIWKKQNKQWRRLISGYAVHINQGLNFMIALKGWDIIGLPWCMIA